MSDNPPAPARAVPAWVRYELPVVACLALIWTLSNQPSLPGPGERGSLIRDLFNYGSHALIYALLAFLVRRDLLYRAASLPGWLAAHPRVTAALFALGWGLLDEWHQSYIPGRTASPWDALTDLLGAVAGLWLGPHLVALWAARRNPGRLTSRKCSTRMIMRKRSTTTDDLQRPCSPDRTDRHG